MRPGRLASLASLAVVGLLALAPRDASASPGSSLDDDDDDPGDGGGNGGGGGDGGGEADAPPRSAARVAGPSVGEVISEAYRVAGLDRDPARGWSRRARVAGLIPLVTVRTGRNTSWQELDPDVDRGTTIEVRATWHLDRLLFDGRELQVASIDAARRRERALLASRVIRAYFRWRRMAGAAAGPAASAARWAWRAEEAAAELDAFTDGWFSGQLGRARQRQPARSP